MGYAPPYPSDLQAASEMVVADEARYLAEAELYVLTLEMCAVAVAVAWVAPIYDLVETLGRSVRQGSAA